MRREEPDYARALREADRFLRRWRDVFTSRVREDVAQEAVVESWRRLRTLRDERCFEAYVRTVARRLRYRECQRERRWPFQSLDADRQLIDLLEVPEPGNAPALLVDGEWIERAWLVRRLESVMQRLAPLNRRLLSAYYAGTSISELAARHGLSTSRVKARLHRGRRRIHAEFVACVRRTRTEESGFADVRRCSVVSTDR